eukprot:6655494-Pyramimonas_sp.AAC.1
MPATTSTAFSRRMRHHVNRYHIGLRSPNKYAMEVYRAVRWTLGGPELACQRHSSRASRRNCL